MDVMLKDADLDNDGHSPTLRMPISEVSLQTLCELMNIGVDHDMVFHLNMLQANL